MDIFVSYTSEDREKAFWIGRDLEALGHGRVSTIGKYRPGAIWWMMEKNIEYSDRVLCIVSPAYLTAPYSSWERKAASWASVIGRQNFCNPDFY